MMTKLTMNLLFNDNDDYCYSHLEVTINIVNKSLLVVVCYKFIAIAG